MITTEFNEKHRSGTANLVNRQFHFAKQLGICITLLMDECFKLLISCCTDFCLF